MEVNEEIMSKIIKSTDLTYVMSVGDKTFNLENVSVMKTQVPVRRPTMRGGVYFADTAAYKVRASTRELSILSLLPRIMLGPNTEFQPVEIKTSLTGGKFDTVLIAHVANTMNTNERVELNLIVDKTRP